MTLQQTALQQPAEAGENWVLEQAQGADPAQQQPDPTNADALDPQQPLQNPEPPRLSPMEEVALELGWTPQDKWRGDPNKWTPASEYLRTTGRVLERTKHELKQYRGTVQTLEQRLARVEQGHQTLEAQRAEALNADYEDAKFKAAQEGNQELYRKLVKEQAEQMAKFRPADRPGAPQQPQAQELDVYAQAEAIMADPIAARFFQANPIALSDERAWELMDREMTRVAQSGGGSAAQFRAAEDALRYAYAEQYEQGGAPRTPHHSHEQPREQGRFAPQQPQQPRRPAPPVSAASPVNGAPVGDKSAVDRLDGEARAFLNAQVQAGKVKDAELWARTYLGEKPSIIGAKK